MRYVNVIKLIAIAILSLSIMTISIDPIAWPTMAKQLGVGDSSTSFECQLDLTPQSLTFSFIGGVKQIRVNAAGNSCQLKIRNNTSWIEVTQVLNNGTGVITLKAGPTIASRAGTLVIGKQTVTVFQEVSPCPSANYAPSQEQAIRGFDLVRNKVADLNGDGIADFAGPYSSAGILGIMFGTGAGNFYNLRTYPAGHVSSLEIADFNNDGSQDLAFYELLFSRITIMINDGKGNFTLAQQIDPVKIIVYPDTNVDNRHFMIGDFNNDGKVDLVVNTGPGESPRDVRRIVILLGNGNGTFGDGTINNLRNVFSVLPTQLNRGFEIGDFNGDGDLDFADWMSLELSPDNNRDNKFVRIWSGNGNGNFIKTAEIDLYDNIWSLSSGDMNGDGRTDLIAFTTVNSIKIVLANSNGQFDPPNEYLIPENIGYGLVIGDVNGDNKADVIANNSVGVLLNKGSGSLSTVTSYRNYGSVSLGDVNGDGITDLILFNGYLSNFRVTTVANRNRCLAINEIVATSAASYSSVKPASESIAALFGQSLSNQTLSAAGLPLPTSLENTSVKIKDSRGNEHLAPLFFTSPGQINFQMPQAASLGTAVISVNKPDGSIAAGVIEITKTNPGIFSADATGAGMAAAVALRIKANGEQVYEPVGQFDPATNRFAALPIDVSNPAEQVFLLLYGTGFRHHSGLNNIKVTINGADAEVLFAGAQGDFVGLDQCNVRLATSLAGSGEISIALTADGKASNTVKARIK